MHGTKKDAKRVAAQPDIKPKRNAGGKKVGQVLNEWIEVKTPT